MMVLVVDVRLTPTEVCNAHEAVGVGAPFSSDCGGCLTWDRSA